MWKLPARRRRATRRRRLLQELRRRAEWVDEARTTPTLRCLLEPVAPGPAGGWHREDGPGPP